MDLELKTLPSTRVAYMRHVGPYGDSGIVRLWQRFGAWCERSGQVPSRQRVYGISHDSPDTSAPNKCRYDACITVDAGFQPQGEVGVQTLAGGLNACMRFVGTASQIPAAWMQIVNGWLPGSDYQVDDRPCVEWYDRGADVDSTTGVFTCLLCLPVRAL